MQWRTSKAQEVFALLLHNRGQWVLKDTIVDLVWPDFKPEKAVANLHTTVYHIRKLLKAWDMEVLVEFSQERYRLTKEQVLLDVEEFELGYAGTPVESEEEWLRREKYIEAIPWRLPARASLRLGRDPAQGAAGPVYPHGAPFRRI
ncbi:hypothetical protein ACFSQ7_03180 [Paenibacillus rhizoplanae]